VTPFQDLPKLRCPKKVRKCLGNGRYFTPITPYLYVGEISTTHWIRSLQPLDPITGPVTLKGTSLNGCRCWVHSSWHPQVIFEWQATTPLGRYVGSTFKPLGVCRLGFFYGWNNQQKGAHFGLTVFLRFFLRRVIRKKALVGKWGLSEICFR